MLPNSKAASSCDAEMPVLYADEWFVAVDKPSGLRTTPAFKGCSKDGGEGVPDDSWQGGGSEKAGGDRPAPNKRKRQERFSDVLRALGDEAASTSVPSSLPPTFPSLDPALAPHVAKLSRERASVPRKRGKFGSYTKRSLRVDDEALVSSWRGDHQAPTQP